MDVQIEITEITASAEITETVINCEVIFNTGGGGEVNLINSISVNGVEQTPDINKNVDIDLAPYQPITDPTLETTAQTIAAAINEVRTIALGADIAYVFDTKVEMEAWLLIPENVALLKVGNLFLIRELTVPDYWWDGVEALELEVKIDLTNYYTKLEIETLFPNETAYTIGALIETTELETLTDETKIAGSVAGVVNWFSGLSLYTYLKGKYDLVYAKISDYFSKTQSDGRYVAQNGGTIYHNTKWFTPTALQTLTINANGTQATLNSGTSFTASMTGAKLRVIGSESAPIITYQSSTIINLSPALDSALFGQVVAFGDWGVYGKALEFMSNGDFWFYGLQNNQMFRTNNNNPTTSNIYSLSGMFTLSYNGLDLGATSMLKFGNLYASNFDSAMGRNSAGVLEINNGTAGQYRDLILRKTIQTGILEYADNTAALAGGLTAGMQYRTGDLLKIVH